MLRLLLLCLFFFASFEIHAQHGWSRLSELRPGDNIVVVQLDQREFEGEFLGFGSDRLSMRSGTRGLMIERARIVRVTLRRKSRWLRHALLGTGLGFGAAIALDRTVGTRLERDGSYQELEKAAVWGLPIIIGGAAGIGFSSYPTIYRVEPPR